MLKNKVPMSKIRQALRLYTQGKSKMFIKELTGLSRNTVKKYINLFIQNKHSIEDITNLSDKELDDLFCNTRIEPSERLKQIIECFPDIDKELKRKGITREIVWKQS